MQSLWMHLIALRGFTATFERPKVLFSPLLSGCKALCLAFTGSAHHLRVQTLMMIHNQNQTSQAALTYVPRCHRTCRPLAIHRHALSLSTYTILSESFIKLLKVREAVVLSSTRLLRAIYFGGDRNSAPARWSSVSRSSHAMDEGSGKFKVAGYLASRCCW